MRNSFSSNSSLRRIAHRIRRFLFVGAGVLGVVTTAAADDRIEIVPYAGFRTGGDFEFEDVQQHAHVDSQGSLALALNLDIDANSQYQVYFSRQATRIEPTPATPGGTDLDVAYLHFGGTLTPDTNLALKPYLVGTLGATWFSPDAVGAHENRGVAEAARHEGGHADIGAAPERRFQSEAGERQFANIEIAGAEGAKENLLGHELHEHRIDAVDLHGAIHQRPVAVVVADGDGEIEERHGQVPVSCGFRS